MASTVRRPSHYDTLGIEPTASDEEIAHAFAQRMSRAGLRPMSAAMQIYAAYETLRSPDKRRAYDEAHGLGAKAAPFQWTPAAARWNGMPFAMPTRANAVGQAAGFAEPPRVPPAAPRAESPRGPFIAASPPAAASDEPPKNTIKDLLRRLEEHSQSERRAEPESAPQITPEPPFDRSDHQVFLRAVEARLGEAETPPKRWNRTALIVGGVFAGVVLVGAGAGTIAGSDVDAAEAKRAVTLDLPKPKPVAAAAIAPSFDALDAPTETPTAHSVAVRRTQAAPAMPLVASGEPETDALAPLPADVAAEPTVAEPAPVETAAARMPLPDAVIAATIRRIGYSCGEVSSTRPVEGAAAGVFAISCSSGQSYQATPIRGRYRFRRL